MDTDGMSTAYQIKSTPFFRRIVSTSKANGQLQRLKEEYERIKNFSEQNIDLRMRQVRLKRLFRGIDEIKESSSIAVHNPLKRVRIKKTEQERRIEGIIRAKELGNEISRVNRMAMRRYVDYSQSSLTLQTSAAAAVKMAALSKRILLGNELSRANMEKIKKSRLKQQTSSRVNLLEEEDKRIRDHKLSMLQKRLEYGNKAQIKASRDSKKSAMQAEKQIQQQPSENDKEYEMNMHRYASPHGIEADRNPNAAKLLRDLLPPQKVRQPSSLDDVEASERARRRWHQLALTVRCRPDKVGNAKNQEPLDQTIAPSPSYNGPSASDSLFDFPDLPMEFDGESEGYLDDIDDLPPPPPPPLRDIERELNDYIEAETLQTTAPSEIILVDLPDLAAKIIDPYKQLVRSTAEKEAMELTVNHLRNIFENSTE